MEAASSSTTDNATGTRCTEVDCQVCSTTAQWDRCSAHACSPSTRCIETDCWFYGTVEQGGYCSVHAGNTAVCYGKGCPTETDLMEYIQQYKCTSQPTLMFATSEQVAELLHLLRSRDNAAVGPSLVQVSTLQFAYATSSGSVIMLSLVQCASALRRDSPFCTQPQCAYHSCTYCLGFDSASCPLLAACRCRLVTAAAAAVVTVAAVSVAAVAAGIMVRYALTMCVNHLCVQQTILYSQTHMRPATHLRVEDAVKIMQKIQSTSIT
jgi:hypothetical protein